MSQNVEEAKKMHRSSKISGSKFLQATISPFVSESKKTIILQSVHLELADNDLIYLTGSIHISLSLNVFNCSYPFSASPR